MKGLALEVVWGLIIAIFAVLVFLSLVTGTFKTAANWFYCDVYIKVVNFFRGSNTASIPESCRDIIKPDFVRVEVKDTDNKIFSRRLLAYIIACWSDAETRGLYQSHPCYELRILNKVDNVSEENVSSILINEDHCISIENSDYECGAKNQILWSVDGTIVSLTKSNITNAINTVTLPSQIPVTDSMIPDITSTSKLQLKEFIVSDVPNSICSNIPECYMWGYNKSTGYVSFNISNVIYNYTIDSVTSYLERFGMVRSVIENQTIILIEYQGFKDAVEVIG